MSDNVEVLERYLKAAEAFAPRGEIEAYFTADAIQEEMPNRLFAEGRRLELAAMMANYEKGPKVLSSQRYRLRRAVAQGDDVAAELEWSGVLRAGFGAYAAGATMRASIAIFFTFRGGKIASLCNYDCYLPA